MKKLIHLIILLVLTSTLESNSQEKAFMEIVDELVKIEKKSSENALVMPFESIGFEDSAYGLYVADKISAHLMQKKRFSLIEREKVSSILEEQKLSMYGLIKKEEAQKIGTLLSVNIIITGRLYRTDAGAEISVRAIDTETGKLLTVVNKKYPIKTTISGGKPVSGFVGKWKVVENAPYLTNNDTEYKSIELNQDNTYILTMINNNGSEVEIHGKYEIKNNNINYYSGKMLIDGNVSSYTKLSRRLEGTIYLEGGRLYFNYTSMGYAKRVRLDAKNKEYRCTAVRDN